MKIHSLSVSINPFTYPVSTYPSVFRRSRTCSRGERISRLIDSSINLLTIAIKIEKQEKKKKKGNRE